MKKLNPKFRYFLVAPSVQQVRCLLWLRRWINELKLNVHVNDVTGLYTALDVVGPSSRTLMKDVTGRDMSATEFPSFSVRGNFLFKKSSDLSV